MLDRPGIYSEHLRKDEWEVRPVDINVARQMVEQFHYAKGASNTAIKVHGLFRRGDVFDGQCAGIAWWLPPTKPAAWATFPDNWQGVLSLSRMVMVPGVPKNACSFLLSRAVKDLNPETWPCLVTYADEWQGHGGGVYRAAGWEYLGLTKPERVYVLANGRMIARKSGAKTRTHDEMVEIGARCIGSFAKHKYRLVRAK